jgi:hypothetical protein
LPGHLGCRSCVSLACEPVDRHPPSCPGEHSHVTVNVNVNVNKTSLCIMSFYFSFMGYTTLYIHHVVCMCMHTTSELLCHESTPSSAPSHRLCRFPLLLLHQLFGTTRYTSPSSMHGQTPCCPSCQRATCWVANSQGEYRSKGEEKSIRLKKMKKHACHVAVHHASRVFMK